MNRPNLIYIGKIDYSVLEEKEPESIEKEIISSSSAPSTSILSSDIENLKDRTSTAERSGDLKNKCQDISKLNQIRLIIINLNITILIIMSLRV